MNINKYCVSALSMFFVVAFPLSSNAGWFGPSNFDECMVKEMKGQPSNAYGHVYALCRNRFPTEEPKKKRYGIKPDAFKYSWRQGQINATLFEPSKPYVAIEFTKAPAGIKFAEVVARFSVKECASSADGDFSHHVAFKHFLNMRASTYTDAGVVYGCMRLEDVFVYE